MATKTKREKVTLFPGQPHFPDCSNCKSKTPFISLLFFPANFIYKLHFYLQRKTWPVFFSNWRKGAFWINVGHKNQWSFDQAAARAGRNANVARLTPLAAMETKGRMKVASLQGSTNTCMQWAVVGPPGDERRRTGGDGDGGKGSDGADGCGVLARTISPRGSQPPTPGGITERVPLKKTIPILSLATPPHLCSSWSAVWSEKKIWILSTQHAGILFS